MGEWALPMWACTTCIADLQRVKDKRPIPSLQVALPAISQDAESFQIPAAPDLIPNGAWEKLPNGNVTTPKGFKATGELDQQRQGLRSKKRTCRQHAQVQALQGHAVPDMP